MSTQRSGPSIRTMDQDPVHINDVNIQVDYSCDDDDNLVTEVNDVQYINLNVNNNNNNNNSTTSNNLHAQRRRRHPHQITLFQYLPQSFRARYCNKNDDITNELWGPKIHNKIAE